MTRGMDFPNDVRTNVYKIDNVKEIHWAVYARTKNEEEQDQRASPDVEEKEVIDAIQVVVRSLRNQGQHVLLDEGLDSGYTKSSDLALTTYPAQGTTTPKLANTAKPPLQPVGVLGEINIQTFHSNKIAAARPLTASLDAAKKGLSDGGRDSGMPEIYQKITLALSQSLIHALSKEQRFLQIGSSICVDERTLGDNDSEFLEYGPANSKSNTISCNVRWLSSGLLLFFLCENFVPRLCTLSRSSLPIDVGDSVLLSPSGIVGQFYGMEKSSKAHPLSRSEIGTKARISAWLVRSGFPMPENTRWIYVLVARSEGQAEREEPPTDVVHTGLTLWPAHLCLCKDIDYSAEASIAQNFLGSLDGPNDPLNIAQSWFLGKTARSEALELGRQKDLAEAEKPKEIEDIDEEDVLGDWQRQSSQVTPRDVSGIYPTPPDGLPSAVHNPTTGNDPQFTPNDDETNVVTGNDGKHQPYDENGHDELFEDMDIDMFATNGLTEDDFSFFDDPNVNVPGEPMFCGDEFVLEGPANTASSTLLPEDYPSPAMVQSDEKAESLDPLPDPGKLSHSPEESLVDESNHTGQAQENDLSASKQKSGNEVRDVKEETVTFPGMNIESLLPQSSPQKIASFNAVPFPDISSEFDNKYTSQGRYGVDPDDIPDDLELEEPSRPSRTLSQTGVTRAADTVVENGLDIGIGGIPFSIRRSFSNLSTINDTDDEASSKSSETSIGQRSYETSEEDYQQSSRKRKRHPSEELDNPATPLSSVLRTETAEKPKVGTATAPEALFALGNDGLAAAFLGPKPTGGAHDTAKMLEGERTFIRVAQMVAEQAISSINTFQEPLQHLSDQIPTETAKLYQQVRNVLGDWSSRSGKSSNQCTFKDFVELDYQDSSSAIRDHSVLHQKAQKPSYPPRVSSATGQPVTKLPSPYTCVQRSGTSIDIAASALRFWEELSLAPSHDSKDVTAYCIYPEEREIQDEVVTFLNMMKGAYQSNKLGAHDLGSDLIEDNGLVPIPMVNGKMSQNLPEMDQACENFGLRLGKLKLGGANTVIYMVNPSCKEDCLPLLCAAFWKLFNAYRAVLKDNKATRANDLVLQIIPPNLIYSATEIILPSPADYRRLAFEVYDRCGPKEKDGQRSRSQYMYAPSTRLAKPVPKTIDFRLTPENHALSLQADNCLHIAYAWTHGEKWLTASWTDNLGILSWTACYCFGIGSDAPWGTLFEIANEIWETTLDMLQPRNGPWRLLLCKDGSVSRRELDAWQAVVANALKPPIKLSVLFDFLTIEANPLLDFPMQTANYKGLEFGSTSLETPESTPQASAPSPDIAGLGSTPGGAMQTGTPPSNPTFGDHDAEARLVDITDETWGVAMNCSVDDICLPSEACPALASGFLLKRAGPRDEDGVVRIGVNIIHGQKPYRGLLKAVLGMYRNLGLLARVRGIADPVRGIEPYHVAVVRKAHYAVNATMRYGNG